MNPFEYPRIGRELVDSLAGTLTGGGSVLVLGGRNVGKRYLIRQLHGRVAEQGAKIGVASFLDAAEENEPHGSATDRFLRGIDCLPPRPSAVLDWCRSQCLPGVQGSTVLLLANLDSLPDHELEELVVGLKESRLGGVLATGEARGVELFHGPKAIWRADRKLIVSGFAREEFSGFARNYLDHMKIPTRDPEGVIEALFERTGGNIYFLRVLLWVAFDRWASSEGSEADAIDPSDLPRHALASQIPWNHYLRYVTRLIGYRPEIWGRLQELLRFRDVAADPDGPDLLELTGIPVREGNRLTLPGWVSSRFLELHYDAQKFADLHAGRGDWGQAFDLLQGLGDDRKPRPTGVDDIPDAGYMIKRLVASLHEEVVKGPERLRERFQDGCRLLLGFSEVDFWSKGPSPEAPWQNLDTEEPAPDWLAPILARPARPREGRGVRALLYPVPPAEEKRTVVAKVSSEHPALAMAVSVRDPSAHRKLADVRLEMLRELLDGFLAAYRHALRDERVSVRSHYRHQRDAVVTKILGGLGTEFLTIKGAVELAARTLREDLGYGRVMVALRTPDGKGLRGFVEESSDPEKTLKKVANFSLDPPDQSFHVEVALKGRPIRARYIPAHPLANQDAAATAEITAGAFIPLDTGRRDPKTGLPWILGSLVVEREDGLPPDRAEFNDLIQFGRQLAGIVEQSERVQLLQETLNLQREPLAILDAGGRLRYANQPASSFLGADYHHGWRHPEDSMLVDLDLSLDKPREGRTLLSQATQTARLAFHHNNRFATTASDPAGPTQGRQTWAVLADVIQGDGDGDHPLGVFVEAQDLSFLHRVFDAFGRLLLPEILYPELEPDASTASGALEDRLVKEIGRAFAANLAIGPVFYDRYDADRGRFVRVRRHEFPSGEPTPSIGGYSYAADEQSTQCFQPIPSPAVFQFDPDRKPEADATVLTSKGLVATAVHDRTGSPAGLKAQGLWVDYPLLSGNRRLGKLVFACDEGFLPENFELLKTYLTLFGGIIGALFELTKRHEANAQKRLAEKETAAMEAVQHFVHQLKQPIKPVPLMLNRLRKSSAGNRDLLDVMLKIEETIGRFDHYAGLIQAVDALDVRPSPCDLPSLIRETLKRAAPRDRYEIILPSDHQRTGPLQDCEIDAVYFKLALSELVENSRKYCPAKTLRITVTIDLETAGPADPDWITLEFLDNGPGIPPPDKERVFGRGEVVRRRGRKTGTGLGLHCVHQIVQGHLGTIREEGEMGRGVRFVLKIPRRHTGRST